ncbi:MAG: hypothetical protein OEY22_01815 [Candidatus Bathyarchaeota archaeon]|nr:hypothetical protein [Candidatus Bathyarchaeota archaeon]MDH5787440.1 hypothetical protein [Candidatus Bathyarchaeota archaeon]
MVKDTRPWWWKPLWIGIFLNAIALAVFNYFFLHYSLERAAGWFVLILFCTGIAYYLRIRPSMKANRVNGIEEVYEESEMGEVDEGME